MRVLLITQGISRIVKPLFYSKHDIVGVIESMPRDFNPNAKKNKIYELLKNIYFIFKRQPSSLNKICECNQIPYNFIHKGRDAEIARWVKRLNPDLIVVFSMSQLLKKEIYDIPKYGTINLHPSFLPEYRGPNPDFWQYYNMEMNPGVSIHYIDEGEDTGDVIFQERVHIPFGTKSPERLDKLIGGVGVPLMIKAIDSVEVGIAPRMPQPTKSQSPRARNLKPEEHMMIIDWLNWPIERIWHVMRGTELWLNAYEQPKGIFKGQRWVVGGFIKEKNIEIPGGLTKYKGKRAVATPEGYIFISVKFNIKKAIISFFNK